MRRAKKFFILQFVLALTPSVFYNYSNNSKTGKKQVKY